MSEVVKNTIDHASELTGRQHIDTLLDEETARIARKVTGEVDHTLTGEALVGAVIAKAKPHYDAIEAGIGDEASKKSGTVIEKGRGSRAVAGLGAFATAAGLGLIAKDIGMMDSAAEGVRNGVVMMSVALGAREIRDRFATKGQEENRYHSVIRGTRLEAWKAYFDSLDVELDEERVTKQIERWLTEGPGSFKANAATDKLTVISAISTEYGDQRAERIAEPLDMNSADEARAAALKRNRNNTQIKLDLVKARLKLGEEALDNAVDADPAVVAAATATENQSDTVKELEQDIEKYQWKVDHAEQALSIAQGQLNSAVLAKNKAEALQRFKKVQDDIDKAQEELPKLKTDLAKAKIDLQNLQTTHEAVKKATKEKAMSAATLSPEGRVLRELQDTAYETERQLGKKEKTLESVANTDGRVSNSALDRMANEAGRKREGTTLSRREFLGTIGAGAVAGVTVGGAFDLMEEPRKKRGNGDDHDDEPTPLPTVVPWDD